MLRKNPRKKKEAWKREAKVFILLPMCNKCLHTDVFVSSYFYSMPSVQA